MPLRSVAEDALFGGDVVFFQPARGSGYRVNVDAFLLSGFAANRPARLAVDLGAGAGAVGLALLYWGTARRVVFVEREAALSELCRRNLESNGFAARATVRKSDVKLVFSSSQHELRHSADLVVCNPPYVSDHRDAGHAAEQPTRRAARQGELAPFLRAAESALGRRGRACFVYPAHATAELVALAREVGLEPKRMRFVHGREDRDARIVLIELARAKPGGLVVMPPLVETVGGQRCPEVAGLLKARAKAAGSTDDRE